MIKINIVCVGKIKEKFYSQAVDEYTKRLSRYCKLKIIELQDEMTPDGASNAEEKQIKRIEGERILKNLSDGSYVIALAIEGRKYSSPGLSKELDRLLVSGVGKLSFVIGGSLGLDKAVLDRADALISFSDMTFPHQLMRVILLEQIYRCFRISSGEPYHK